MKGEFPECPICGDATGYLTSGVFSKYAKCYSCEAKWQLFRRKGRLSELKLHELPKNGSSVATISSSQAPLFTIIGWRQPIDFWKKLELDASINWEYLATCVDPAVSEAVILPKGEEIMYQWRGTKETHGTAITGGITRLSRDTEPGILLLTTRRLLWLKKREHGFLDKTASFHVTHGIQLEEIAGISGETGDSSHWVQEVAVDTAFVHEISISDGKGEYKFHLRNAFLEMFKPMVEGAIERRRAEISTEKKKERLHIMLDFSFLKSYMKNGGLIMKVLKCPECGAKLDFPKSGTETKCTYCGSTILAQDVFEKVKRLLE